VNDEHVAGATVAVGQQESGARPTKARIGDASVKVMARAGNNEANVYPLDSNLHAVLVRTERLKG
jgi:hypothetical protein